VGRRWLDVGCGTGALTRAILDGAAPMSAVGVDRSEGYVAYAKSRTPDERATFAVCDAQALDLEEILFDVAVSGLVLNFVPHPERMVAEMARVVRPGGTVALYVWDYAGEMQLVHRFWDAAAAIDPAAADLDEGARFPLCAPGPLARLWEQAGLRAVETRAIDVPTVFRDFDDYWTPFLGGQGPAPGYAMALTEERRIALREKLRSTLPIAADGSIALMARAWAVRGTSAPSSG
jgi:SAM-dependent methyltransferase